MNLVCYALNTNVEFFIKNNNSPSTLKYKGIIFSLLTGVICFGFILPDSFSDHNKMVHFAAHFGMSFLIASCFYALCTIKLRISKKISYTVLILATLTIGCIYKYFEIASQGMFGNYSFNLIMERTGCLTSMSQNISGLLAAMLIIESINKHLVILPLNNDHFQLSLPFPEK